jgi:holo-[acyl-carrier protein] synthase
MEHKIQQSVDELTAQQAFAVGNDLVCLSVFKLSLTDMFKSKVYTAAETAYCESFDDADLRYASTWAAKEAVYKALKQIDSTPIGWKQIEIIRAKASGKPQVILPSQYGHQVSLTISHDGDYVWALALINNLV